MASQRHLSRLGTRRRRLAPRRHATIWAFRVVVTSAGPWLAPSCRQGVFRRMEPVPRMTGRGRRLGTILFFCSSTSPPISLHATIARLAWVFEDGMTRRREVWGIRQKQQERAKEPSCSPPSGRWTRARRFRLPSRCLGLCQHLQTGVGLLDDPRQGLKDRRGRNAGSLPAVRAADPALQVVVPPPTITRRRRRKENLHDHRHCARKYHRAGDPKRP
jgi:hypothetical protein